MPLGKVVNITKIRYRVAETILVVYAIRRNSNHRKAKFAGRTVSENRHNYGYWCTARQESAHNITWLRQDNLSTEKRSDVVFNAEKLQVSDTYVPLNEGQQ